MTESLNYRDHIFATFCNTAVQFIKSSIMHTLIKGSRKDKTLVLVLLQYFYSTKFRKNFILYIYLWRYEGNLDRKLLEKKSNSILYFKISWSFDFLYSERHDFKSEWGGGGGNLEEMGGAFFWHRNTSEDLKFLFTSYYSLFFVLKLSQRRGL